MLRILLLIAASLAVSSAGAQPARVVGTLVLAHGGGPDWNAGVLTAVRGAKLSGPIEVSFLMGPDAATHRFQDQVAKLERAGATEVVIVPLLVSSFSGHYEQIRWLARRTDSLDAEMQHHLHMSGIARPAGRATLRVARGFDDAPELADILADRARALTKTPAQQALLLIGHGPNSAEDYALWMKHLRAVAARVQSATGFSDVKVDVVRDDAPPAVRAEAVLRIRELASLQARMTGRDVVVVPILISRSSVGDQRFRADLRDLPVTYAGDPLLPHPLVSRWIERRVAETVALPRQ